MNSNMPSADIVRSEQVMRIERVLINELESEVVKLNIDCVTDNGAGTRVPQVVSLYKLDVDRVRGHLPSKVLFDTERRLHAIFYCSSLLPKAVKAFGDGPTYICYFAVNRWQTVEYDVEFRLFIDQVLTTDGTIHYVIMFGQDMYDKIVATSKAKQSVSEQLQPAVADLIPENERLLRTVLRQRESGGWDKVRLAQIRKGDTFRVFEPDGTVVAVRGGVDLVATEDGDESGVMIYCDEGVEYIEEHK